MKNTWVPSRGFDLMGFYRSLSMSIFNEVADKFG